MTIGADGFFDWAERRPGPANKQYSTRNTMEFFVPHSLEGTGDGFGVISSAARQASWCGTVMKDGRLVQFYPVWTSCWASGNAEINTRAAAFEHEGFAGQPVDPRQVQCDIRILADLKALTGRTYQRVTPVPKSPPLTNPPGVGRIVEHNEVALWATPNAGPTACPSGRIQPLYDALSAPQEEEMTKDERERMERLERIVAGWGIVTSEGVALSGEDALAHADEKQWSAFLGLGLLRGDISNMQSVVSTHLGSHPSGGGKVPAHTHTPGGVA